MSTSTEPTTMPANCMLTARTPRGAKRASVLRFVTMARPVKIGSTMKHLIATMGFAFLSWPSVSGSGKKMATFSAV